MVKSKPRKKRTAKSNTQKDYEERKSKLFQMEASPMNSFKVPGRKTRVNSINQPGAMKKVDMSMIKSFKLASKNIKGVNHAKLDIAKCGANFEVAKSHPFKLSQKSTSKSKYSNRRSLSGSNKTVSII